MRDDAPITPPCCPGCGKAMHPGADPDHDWCNICKGISTTLDRCADKAKALHRQIEAAARNAGYPDNKQRDIYLRIAHNCLSELKQMLPSYD